jgi:sortase A
VRRLRSTLRLPADPLLKAGVLAMAFALVLAGIVAGVAVFTAPVEPAAAVGSSAKPTAEPLTRSDPGVDPWVEERVLLPSPERQSTPEPAAQAQSRPADTPPPQPEREPRGQPEAEPGPRSEPLSAAEADWPLPTQDQVEVVNRPRQYELDPGAILGLTIESLDLYDVPVLDSNRTWALNSGVVHEPETSLPWSQTPERNVYLVGHRLGWPGTESHLVFYRLNDLSDGDEIILRDRDGVKYEYQVIDTFVVDPSDTWVMGRVRDRDLLTLQTCTPIPSFDKRLIVRAERV